MSNASVRCGAGLAPGGDIVSEEPHDETLGSEAKIDNSSDSLPDDLTDDLDPEVIQDDDLAEDSHPPRDTLSLVLVAGIAALLLICILLVFVANRHRPAGL